MEIRSLGIRSQLIFHRFEGEVVDRGDHLAIRTPDNPTYRWGNYLLFDRAPRAGDLERWTDLFRAEIGERPHIRHRVFTWNASGARSGEIQPFLDAGYDLHREHVLTTQRLAAPSRLASDLEVRPLASAEDWAAAVDLQVRINDDEPPEGFRTFRERKMRSYRAMQDAGLGFWFGGFVADQMVANCGLFAAGGIGRYQHVETASEARRRGYARTLLTHATAIARERLDIDVLVIHADPDYHAIELYRSLGFEDVEEIAGVEKVDASG